MTFSKLTKLSTLFRVNRSRVHAVRKLIREAEADTGIAYFDEAFYVAQRTELPGAGDALKDYLSHGWRLSLDPSSHFGTSWYLETNPDVRDSGRNPLVHFLKHGRREGRAPKPALQASQDDHLEHLIVERNLDAEFYLAQLPGHSTDVTDPVDHYRRIGWRQGLDPSETFSTSGYLRLNPDVEQAGVNPLLHYLKYGKEEGRDFSLSDFRPPSKFGQREIDRYDDAETIRPYFDEMYYRRQVRSLDKSIDAVQHYIDEGAKLLLDPSPHFSTQYYLSENPDVWAQGRNPFVHFVRLGRSNGRYGLPYGERVAQLDYHPTVAAIIPNYNHARFLTERIESILRQSYNNIEILMLDDCSTDGSRMIIERYAALYPGRIRAIFNSENSGSVFSQWRKGVNESRSELVWICESDDTCEPDFVEQCVKLMGDRSVMIAFGRIQYVNAGGDVVPGLDQYREAAEPDIWAGDVVRHAAEWFRCGFATSNLIPNVGGCLLRRQIISDETWRDAIGYRVLGDWFLYLVLAQGGRIAYAHKAKSYFRQHSDNTSVSIFTQPLYFSEHEQVAVRIREQWGMPDESVLKMYMTLYRHRERLGASSVAGDLASHFSVDTILSRKRSSVHVLMCSYGFSLGGGELFPIYLANELVERDYIVSFLILKIDKEIGSIRDKLDMRIPIYDAQLVQEAGLAKFIERARVDLIHSHNVEVDAFLMNNAAAPVNIPYIVTLHGSYEVTDLKDIFLMKMLRIVSRWIYLSPNNLRHLDRIPVSRDRLTCVANGVPLDERPFPLARKDLGIGPDDLVFILASRAIKDKGWEIAIRATLMAQTRTDRVLRLLLCGEGPEAHRLEKAYGGPAIQFLGFQDRVAGFYALSDVVLLPTRFAGESLPLSLIQSFQAGRASIATDVGRIRDMLTGADADAGVVVPNIRDDGLFAEALYEAMLRLTDDDYRRALAMGAAMKSARYDMASTADDYVHIYRTELARSEASRGDAGSGMVDGDRHPG